EVKTERANECRLFFILHSRDLDVEKLKWIYIEPTNHPLVIEQREGITLPRVKEMKEIVILQS
ncbi:hypothetical protein CN525_09320, partial [Bacillus sp. AFS014408]